MRQFLVFLTMVLLLNLTACKEKVEHIRDKENSDPSLCVFSQGECVKTIAGIKLSFTISPSHAPSEKPLTLNILSSAPISDVHIRLEGRDMFMGIIPVNVRQVDEMNYIGQMVYGSCSSGYMVWRGFVNFTVNGKPQTAIFDFLADSDIN
ncbi:hypothetical protein N5094_10040 [Shewanella putrefaciens]|uniref:hypothetical protein n=1 Tax=Shewanella putrefaciens TaxID=24 RepID=UPI0021C0C85A|nr:hypothetical protein [Shewanella putrefaciens]UXK10495.1 hypothetical protein N5094_10040 [Shewanella putrefaciens]